MTQRSGTPPVARRIPPLIDDKTLDSDLHRLRCMALDEGAAQVAIIGAENVFFSREVKARADADNRCPSIHWPLVYPKDSIQDAVMAYRAGVFFLMGSGSDMPDYGGGPITDQGHRDLYFKTADIVSGIESAAFYLGYHLALGLTSGNCKSVFCADEKRCQALIRGQKCRQPYKGRPSLAAAGIDAIKMAQHAHFMIPTGASDSIPAGLIMIA